MLHEINFIADNIGTRWQEDSSLALLNSVVKRHRIGQAALVTSFGAESAILLHLASRVDLDIPVLFVNTRMMFQETLDYQLELSKLLGFRDVRIIVPEMAAIEANDPDGTLHQSNPDACCHFRKVAPLDNALKPFSAWITGRKRNQTAARHNMKPVEIEANGRLKVNPLLHWESDDIDAYFKRHQLPSHPLVSHGFTSIGCAPCTSKPVNGQDPRSGRWQGKFKTECGIHRPVGQPASAPN